MSELVFADEFFAPVSSDLVDQLIGQYQAAHTRINAVADFVTDELNGGVIHYFIEGNCDEKHGRMSLKSSAGHLFNPAGAVAALNSAYWSKAMHLTDVLDYMPQKRREEWHESIRNQTCPEFEEDTVRSTLSSLLAMRGQFLAERVDGIFRGLSGEHVTNSPAAFGKRMIVGYVLNEYWSENYNKCGLINDLRCVVAKFMGRDEPKHNASSGLIRTLKGRWGEWVPVDGGALRIRLYKKGTAHIEVHPDMAWRLNSVLASLYPMAIPAEFRTKPKRKPKDVQLIQRPVSFAAIEVLAGMKQATRTIKQEDNWRNPYRHENVKNALKYEHYGKPDKHVMSEVAWVLQSIGGVKSEEGWWQFDYDPREVLNDIVASGCIPDHKSHQFYPTPTELAQKAVELAEIGNLHVCLEPSAGVGGLADFMPKDRTQCVEVSELHCQILKAKGFDVSQSDFLKFDGFGYHRIVMNPPFDRGQWQAHIEHAATMLGKGGRLVAILPSGAKNKDILPGFAVQWSEVFDNQFDGASVSVVILIADKP